MTVMSITFYDLRCMFLDEPVGLDSRQLVFSWKMKCEESQTAMSQTGSQIQIFDANGKMTHDTQKIQTGNQTGLYLTVPGLQSNQKYFWHVRIWDGNNQMSLWSQKKPFITGLLSGSEWQAKWIHGNDLPGVDPYKHTFCFRKELVIGEKPSMALLHIASAGIHEIYCNTQKVGDRVMAPSQTNLRGYKHLRSVSYDITQYLRVGTNEIRIWLDAGWTRQAAVLPCTAAQIELAGREANHTIVSDKTWQCKIGSCSHIGGNYDWFDFGGEQICDDLESEDADIWMPAAEYPINPHITWDQSYGNRVLQKIVPRSIAQTGDTAVIDMGINYTGWIRLNLRGGEPGRKVEILTADKPEEESSFHQRSEYLFKEETGVFCNRFNFAAGRYITVRGLAVPLEISDVEGLAIGEYLPITGWMETSEQIHNQIYQMDKDTFRANTMSGVTADCPHRERLGYGETGISNCWGAGLQTRASRAFYRQVFENWRNVQEPNGYFPHVAPNFYGGGGIAWGSSLTVALWDYWQYTADRTVLRENYDAILRWADYLCGWIHDGLLQCPKEEADCHMGFLGDWAYYEGNDWAGSPQADFVNNCMAAAVLRIVSNSAQILQETRTQQRLQAAHRRLCEAIHKRYYDEKQKRYFGGEQRYAAIALYAQIMPPEAREDVEQSLVQSLAEKGYMDGGSVGTTFIYRALEGMEAGKALLYRWLQSRDCPSYGYFLDRHQNTIPEVWDMGDFAGGSRIHTCFSGVTGWYTRSMIGLRPENMEENKYVLHPFFPEGMTWLRAENDFGHGPIKIHWTREDPVVTMKIAIPVNARITVACPVGYRCSKEGLYGSGNHIIRYYKTN